jgi:cytochrome P450
MSTSNKYKEIPLLPSVHWFLKGAPPMRSNPPIHLLENHLKHGPIININVPFRLYLSIWEPEYIKHVLVTNNRNYIKDPATRKLSLSLGNGLLTSEGDFWRRQRRIAQPAFHKKRIEMMTERMLIETEKMLEKWAQKSPEEAFDLSEDMMILTSNIAAKSLFGADLENNLAIGKALLTSIRFITAAFRKIFMTPLWVPTKDNLKFNRAQKVLDQSIQQIVDHRRSQPQEEHHDLLSMLMEARDEETGEGMTDRQIRDEMITLFSAGHETSANGLNWTFYNLNQHPEITAKVVEEIQTVLQGRRPTPADLMRLSYTRQVLMEVMRLYPPAWAIGREPLEDDVIDGYLIPKGTAVVMAPYALHRNPAFWEDPEKFDPSRFEPEKIKTRHKFAYMPFGGGPRLCIGKDFAIMEMLAVLALVLSKYEVKLEPDHPIDLEPLITLRPLHGIRAWILPR